METPRVSSKTAGRIPKDTDETLPSAYLGFANAGAGGTGSDDPRPDRHARTPGRPCGNGSEPTVPHPLPQRARARLAGLLPRAAARTGAAECERYYRHKRYSGLGRRPRAGVGYLPRRAATPERGG